MRISIKHLLLCVFIASSVISCGGGEDEPVDNGGGEPKTITFNIATYNMKFDSSSDPYRWSDVRKYLARDIIKKHNFDIWGSQELLEHQVKDVLELTEGVYEHVGVSTGNGQPVGSSIKPTESYDAIFYRKSRFSVLETGDFWYSETPNAPSIWEGAGTKTHCTWAKLKDKESDEEFYVMSSHLEWQNVTVRNKAVDLFLKKVKEIAGDAHVFCPGDYNAETKTDEIKKILNSGFLKDSKALTFRHSDSKNGGTFLGFEKNVDTAYRIDYIFVSPSIKVHSYTVVTDDFKTAGAGSDHLPVVIQASIRK